MRTICITPPGLKFNCANPTCRNLLQLSRFYLARERKKRDLSVSIVAHMTSRLLLLVVCDEMYKHRIIKFRLQIKCATAGGRHLKNASRTDDKDESTYLFFLFFFFFFFFLTAEFSLSNLLVFLVLNLGFPFGVDLACILLGLLRLAFSGFLSLLVGFVLLHAESAPAIWT